MDDALSSQAVQDAEQAFLNSMRESADRPNETVTPVKNESTADEPVIKEEENDEDENRKIAALTQATDEYSALPLSTTDLSGDKSASPSENVQQSSHISSTELDLNGSAHAEFTDSTPVPIKTETPSVDALGANGTPVPGPSSVQASTPSHVPSKASASNVIVKSVSPGPASAAHISHKRKRLPQDIVGQLEDRIAEDPRGDVDAWLALIDEHRKKGKYAEARDVYERLLQIWPTSAAQWIAYARMELDNNELRNVEQIFSRCLLSVTDVDLWSVYLDYVRRINNIATDTSGAARSTISQAYEFVLNNIGIDREAGRIWQEYIAFVKSGPGHIGGSGWQDQQKMDHLRKVYQNAICIPVQGVDTIWQEYNAFEMGLNKVTGRKFTQEKSESYMTARASLHELNNLTAGLVRETLARLPPLPGFQGYEEWQNQISIWRKWIEWEKSDPLVLGADDPTALRTRITYVYRQALMTLRFEPQIWFEFSEYLASQGLESESMDFLEQGMKANPESCLLHFKYAERLEATLPAGDTPETIHQKSKQVRKPYDNLLDVLYGMAAKLQSREREEVAKLERLAAESSDPDAEEGQVSEYEQQITAIKEGTKVQLIALSKTISTVWISLMRAMRRMEGHGKVGDLVGGSRQIFADARRRGKITSDVYVASALIEYHCYKDPAATKIFERGMKLFPEDEQFALEYLKHLIAINDITNARAVFETFVGKVSKEKARRVFEFFHEYESHYGELTQVYKLEKRMAELYPEDSRLKAFEHRYSYNNINPCSYTPVISLQQLKPPAPVAPPVANIQQQQQTPSVTGSPRLPQRVISSPKRPVDDSGTSDIDSSNRPRKIHRPDSPIKGAAGRRLDQKRQQLQRQREGQGRSFAAAAPVMSTLPDGVMFLLGILPGADKYHATRFSPEAIVNLLRTIELPDTPPTGYKR